MPSLTNSNSILLVEDDEKFANLIKLFLNDKGYSVIWAQDVSMALSMITKYNHIGIILDMILPDGDGLDFCRSIIPKFKGWVLMLTAQSDELNEVVAFEAGVDDYLAKPVRTQILLSRVKALSRRLNPRGDTLENLTSDVLKYAEFTIDNSLRSVTRTDGKMIELTDLDFDLLWLLATNAPKILSRDDIMSKLRGLCDDGINRLIDKRISLLRKKLNDEIPPHRIIKTVRQKGYLFVERLTH